MEHRSNVHPMEVNRPHVGKKLYATFSKFYQGQFLSLFSSDEMRFEFEHEWNEYLSDIPLKRIANACQKLKDPFGEYRNRVPNQMQFKALCLPDDQELNIPSFEDAFNHALTHSKYSHPFIAVVTNQLDMYTLRQLNEKDARYRFKEIYEIARKQFLREGKPLPKLSTYLQATSSPVRQVTREERAELQEQEEQARHAAVNKIYNILGRPEKYSTAIDYRQKVIDADNEFNGL